MSETDKAAAVADIEHRARLERAIARLMPLTGRGDTAKIAVPILYPSGSSAAVEIMMNGGRCFVSDLGLGQMEAEMNGADIYYDAAARKAAANYHVGYDGLSIFATWASLENIESAILGVSNASVFAATNSIHKAVEERDRKRNDAVYEKVVRLFGPHQVVRRTDRNRALAAEDEADRLRAEVERLRAGGCARDQTTTQYCAEAARLAAENEKLAEELSIWKSVFPDIAPERVLPDRSKIEAENDRLRAALEWYGEQARLCRLIHSEGDAGRKALDDDGGLRARTALQDKSD